ncbi:unnamed protein product [Closterium sp. NIES-53]
MRDGQEHRRCSNGVLLDASHCCRDLLLSSTFRGRRPPSILRSTTSSHRLRQTAHAAPVGLPASPGRRSWHAEVVLHVAQTPA